MKLNKISFILIAILCVTAISLATGNILEVSNTLEKEISIYPNPVLGDEFTIIANVDVVEVTVINILGLAVFSQKYLNENKIKVELETKDKGIYLVQIKTINGSVTTKRVLFK
jgi:hypothetical protein